MSSGQDLLRSLASRSRRASAWFSFQLVVDEQRQPLAEAQLRRFWLLLLSPQGLHHAVQAHGFQFLDHWLFEHVVTSCALKYCGPRRFSCSGVGVELGRTAGC